MLRRSLVSGIPRWRHASLSSQYLKASCLVQRIRRCWRKTISPTQSMPYRVVVSLARASTLCRSTSARWTERWSLLYLPVLSSSHTKLSRKMAKQIVNQHLPSLTSIVLSLVSLIYPMNLSIRYLIEMLVFDYFPTKIKHFDFALQQFSNTGIITFRGYSILFLFNGKDSMRFSYMTNAVFLRIPFKNTILLKINRHEMNSRMFRPE